MNLQFVYGFVTGFLLSNIKTILEKCLLCYVISVNFINKMKITKNNGLPLFIKVNVIDNLGHSTEIKIKSNSLNDVNKNLQELINKKQLFRCFLYYRIGNKEYINYYNNELINELINEPITNTGFICCNLKYNQRVVYLTTYINKFLNNKNNITFEDVIYNLDDFNQDMLCGKIIVIENNKFLELPLTSSIFKVI